MPLLRIFLLITTLTLRAMAGAASPLTIGDIFLIDSSVLGEQRHINVYAPRVPLDTALPVLYMPDGGMDEDFLHVACLLQVGAGPYHLLAQPAGALMHFGAHRDACVRSRAAAGSSSTSAAAIHVQTSTLTQQNGRAPIMPSKTTAMQC